MIDAALRFRFGGEAAGTHVTIQGLGNAGMRFAGYLAAASARLT